MPEVWTLIMNSSFPIAWHENNLVNFKKSLENKKKELKNLARDVARMESEATFAEHQIIHAKHLKKDKFDSDRFMQNFRSTFIYPTED